MADERMATTEAGPGGSRTMLTYAVLAGLTPLIPVPVLDDVVKGYFRRRLVRALAATQGRGLSDAEVDALAKESGGGCLRGCVGMVLIYPLKKLFRKVFFFLEWKRAVDLTSHTYHFGYLVDYALRPRAGGPSPLDLRGAEQVGRAIETVCRQAPLKPVESAVAGTFRNSKKLLSAAAAMLGQRLRRATGTASRAEVARAIEASEPAEERELAPVVTRLQSSLAAVPEEHFRRLRAALDAHLGLSAKEHGR